MIFDYEVEQEIHRRRQVDKQELYLLVLDRAQDYQAELERDDRAHMARLYKREQALQEAIAAAYEAMKPGPITDEERAHVREILEAA